MPNHSETSEAVAVDRKTLGEQTWEEIQRLFIDWANAVQMADAVDADRAEQDFRLAALTYASLTADGDAVTTGRKAIVRSIVSRLGGRGCIDVLATLDAVIAREEATMRDAQRLGTG